MVNTAAMSSPIRIIPFLLCAALLAGCETEPQVTNFERVGSVSTYLGVPTRVGWRSGAQAVGGPSTKVLDRLRVDDSLVQTRDADSLTLVMSGKPVRVTATLPPMDLRNFAGLRVGYRGSLGGELRLAWREAGDENFRRALGGAVVPGDGVAVMRNLALGPTRRLGKRVSDLAIELPPGEVGTVTLFDVELLLDPGRVLHRVDLDGEVREVLAPGPGRWMEWEALVPSGARLVFDFASAPGMWVSHGDGTRFVVEVREGRRSTRVLDRWISAFAVPEHRGWQSASVDLSAWAGRRVDLRLQIEPGPGAHGVFPASGDAGDDDPLFTVPRLVAGGDERPSVLLIVIDTLRRDALGAYGGGPSPVLDSLAAASTRFDRAWAAGSWTHPSVASLLSGWTPARHGLGYGPAGTTQLAASTPLLAPELRDRGWATAAVSNNAIVSVEDGLGQGFVAFDQRPFIEDQVYGAQRVTRHALEWIDAHPEGPRFLYLHYFDPHDRYQAPPPFTRAFIDPRLEERVSDSSVRAGRPNHFMRSVSSTASALTQPQAEYMRGLYRGEVRYVDHWIGVLLDGMRARGALSNTVVVVTSDHGEEFLEHDGLKHGHTLYDELVAVPLIVSLPGGAAAGSVIDEPVSLLELAPTLRTLLGLPADPGVRTWSVATAMQPARPLSQNWAYGEHERSGPQRALVQWPYKLIQYVARDRDELFDLSKDGAESAPLDDAAWRSGLTAALDSLAGGAEDQAEPGPLDPALLERLKAMGYVH